MRPEHWLFTIPLRLRSLFRRVQADQGLDDELRDHLERKKIACNSGLTERQERRKQNLQARIKTVLEQSGLVLNQFNSDPRGYAAYLDLPDGSYLKLEQGGFNIFRRFRITELEAAEVPAALQPTWSGHATSHVTEVYKKLLRQRQWRLRWAEKTGTGFTLPGHQEGSGGGSKWQVWQDFEIPKSWLSPLESGVREGTRTPASSLRTRKNLR